MASALDVAAYILRRRGPMSGKKLQKLVYYSQAWSLAWTGEPLFADRIEAWRDGPVVPGLFAEHRYANEVTDITGGNAEALTPRQMDTVDSVLGFYADRTAEDLIKMSHDEEPWRDARRGLLSWHAGNSEISHESMRKYYSSLH